MTKHHRVQVNPVLIDQAKFGKALRQVRTGNLDLSVALGPQPQDRALKIIAHKLGVGADRLYRSRHDPFRLGPPRRREGALVGTPFGMVVVPVPHDLVDFATVDTARLRFSL